MVPQSSISSLPSPVAAGADTVQNFLLQSLVASIVLTVLLNVVPRLFPNAAEKAERKLQESMEERARSAEHGEPQPRVRVFFPWKAMLIISIVLTVVLNAAGLFFR